MEGCQTVRAADHIAAGHTRPEAAVPHIHQEQGEGVPQTRQVQAVEAVAVPHQEVGEPVVHQTGLVVDPDTALARSVVEEHPGLAIAMGTVRHVGLAPPNFGLHQVVTMAEGKAAESGLDLGGRS